MRYYLRKFNQEKLRSVSSSSASSSVASPVASPSPVSAFITGSQNSQSFKPTGSAVVQLSFDETELYPPDFDNDHQQHQQNEFADKTIINSHDLDRSKNAWLSIGQTPTPKILIPGSMVTTRSMTRSLINNRRKSIELRLEVDVNVANRNGKFTPKKKY